MDEQRQAYLDDMERHFDAVAEMTRPLNFREIALLVVVGAVLLCWFGLLLIGVMKLSDWL